MTTYRTVAQKLGNGKASRAVGTAVGRNPISWLIPCHRVLGSDGALTGYHWGLTRKRSMLALEAARLQESPKTSAMAYSPGFLPCPQMAAAMAPRAKIMRSSAEWLSTTRSPGPARMT